MIMLIKDSDKEAHRESWFKSHLTGIIIVIEVIVIAVIIL